MPGCGKDFASQRGLSVHYARTHQKPIAEVHNELRTGSPGKSELVRKENTFEVDDEPLKQAYISEEELQPTHFRSFTPKVTDEELEFARLVLEQDLSNESAEAWRRFSRVPGLRSWKTIKTSLMKEREELEGSLGSLYVSANSK